MANLFNGKLFIEPGAAVATDFDSSPKVTALSTGIAVLAAESTNGIPASKGRVYEFSKASDAKSVLKGGVAMDLIYCLFNPSNDYNGADKVLFVRTNDAKQAELKIESSGTPKSITITPVISASQTYVVRFAVTVAGVVNNIDFNFTSDEEATVAPLLTKIEEAVSEITGITVSNNSSTVVITGNSPATTLTLVKDPATTCFTTSETSAVEGELLATIKSVDYGKNQNLAYKFSNGLASFYLDGEVLSVLEDIVVFDDLKNSLEKDIVLSKYFTISLEDGKSAVAVPNTSAVVQFTVYDDTPTNIESFVAALELTASKNKSVVVSQFDTAAYHNAIVSYINNSSDFECHAVLGGALSETPTMVMQRAKALNTEKAILCYPGVYLTLTEETKLYSPVYFAAKVAGLICGTQPQLPLTRKTVAVEGFEEIDFEGNSEKSVRENLINSGVLFGLEIPELGYCINKGINTIQGQNNRQILGVDNKTHEISISRIRYQMQKEIRVSAGRTFPGTTRLKPSKNDVIEFYRSYLNSCVGTYLTGWDEKSLNVYVKEDAWFGEVKTLINGPINQAFFQLSFALDENL